MYKEACVGYCNYLTFLQLIETYSDHASSLSERYKILLQLYTIYKFMVLPRPFVSLFACVLNQLIASIMQDKNKYEQKKKAKQLQACRNVIRQKMLIEWSIVYNINVAFLAGLEHGHYQKHAHKSD